MPRLPFISLKSIATRIDDCAAAWLGYSFPGAAEAIESSHWAADPKDGYCPTCGDVVGVGEVTMHRKSRPTCNSCRQRNLPYDAFVRLGGYVDPLRQWILDIKYKQWAEMADALGRLLGQRVVERGCIPLGQSLIVPMPMPWQRRWYRGIDHAYSIANGVARATGASLERLLASKNGRPQVSLSASDRMHSPKQRIGLSRLGRRVDLSGAEVILVDDVRTTGASLAAAAKLLRSGGAERVRVAVLAVSDGNARRARAQVQSDQRLTGIESKPDLVSESSTSVRGRH